MKPLRIGILGLGSIGKRHQLNLANMGHFPVWHDPNFPNSISRETVLEQDVILICTPSNRHGVDFAECTGKHVFMEKPFGYDCPPYMQGVLLGARSKKQKSIIATGFNCRYHPCVKIAKHMIEHGELGDIVAASFSVNQKSEKPDYLRDGVIRNWLSHEFDIAHHLLGEGTVESCTSDDNVADVVMKFNKVEKDVFIHGDYDTEPHQRYFWVEGTKASIYANLELFTMYQRKGGLAPSEIFLPSRGDDWDHTYIAEMRDFIKSVETGHHIPPLGTGEDGVRALYTVMNARFKAGLEQVEYNPPVPL